MTRNWLITEKVIAAFLVIWGGLVLYVSIYSTYTIYEWLFQSGGIKWEDISYRKVFINYHLAVLLPMLTIFAGLFLLFGKRIGWVAALMAVLRGAFSWLIPANRDSEKSWLTFDNVTMSLITLGVLILFLAIAYLLIRRPFIIKYNPTQKTWWIIASVVFLILLDETIIYLIS